MTQGHWHGDTTQRLAASVKALRGKRSAQWLADRTAELGYGISRTAISNLEVGRKRAVEVPELIVLAAALEVPPILLLYPELPGGEVEILPGITVGSWDAAQWFTGERQMPEAAQRQGVRWPQLTPWVLRQLRRLSDLRLRRTGLYVEWLRLSKVADQMEATASDDRSREAATLLRDGQASVHRAEQALAAEYDRALEELVHHDGVSLGQSGQWSGGRLDLGYLYDTSGDR